MRINKYLAVRGMATRREADELIKKGLVRKNGRPAVLGEQVKRSDTIEIKATRGAYRYYAYNKPRGIVTHSPQEDEKDILTATGLTGVFPIGRLDKDSHGLIILTDDARLTERLLSPDREHEKEYRVKSKAKLPSYFKGRMEEGVEIEGYRTKPCKVRLLSPVTCTVTLTEGKKHQIRRMFAALGAEVQDLERTRIMNIELGSLKRGEWRQIDGKELGVLLAKLGL